MKNKMTKRTGKLWMIAAIAAMTFASCSTEEVIFTADTTGEELALSFSPYVGNSALRTSITNLTALQATGFNVLAWKTDATAWASYAHEANANFMLGPDSRGVAVTWETSSWSYTPVKYWPGKYDTSNYGKVTFFGYAPKTSDIVAAGQAGTGDTRNPTISFTTQALSTNQIDLVADMLPDQNFNTNAGKVKFEFDHILSKIGFSAKLAAEYSTATVKVTKLTVKYPADKIKNTGTYTFATDNSIGGIWTTGSTYMSGNDDILTSATIQLNNSSASVIDNGNYLMLIPQATELGNIIAELSYTITTGGETIPYTIQANLPAVTWLPGRQYVYTFVLTLNSVLFDTLITVNGWEAGTPPGNVNVP
ncbi:MAG: fimbrillin family protein [Dysgonamonadaceae bacterium]|jgi:hypothetical protein|nr:fimbrillin family protein [Dysgonamonadaceae bacterium]